MKLEEKTGSENGLNEPLLLSATGDPPMEVRENRRVLAQDPLVDELVARGAGFLRTALEHLSRGEQFHRFFVDAGSSVEFLGKAVLASLSPALIVPNHFPSLATVLGLPLPDVVNPRRVRTITAIEVIERILSVPEFESLKAHKPRLAEIVHIRNGTIHFVDSPNHKFAPLVVSLSKYISAVADYLEVQVTPELVSADHAHLLAEFTSRDQSVWAGLARTRVAAARHDLTETDPIPANPRWPTADRDWESDLPSTIIVPGRCPACGHTTGFAYHKNRLGVLHAEEEGTTYMVEYRLRAFACPDCELALDNPWLCEGARIPIVAELHTEWKVEFEANPYAYWGWIDEDYHDDPDRYDDQYAHADDDRYDDDDFFDDEDPYDDYEDHYY